MQRKGTRVNPILGDQSGIPISHLRAKANKKRGDYVAARRKTRTLSGGRIVSLNVVPYNHRKLDWSDGGNAPGPTQLPIVPNSLAAASLWPTGGAFMAFVGVTVPKVLDGGTPSKTGTDFNAGPPSALTTVQDADGGKAVAA